MPRIADASTREPDRRPRAGRLRAAARPPRAQAAQPPDPCRRRRRRRGARDGDRPRSARCASDLTPADPPVEPRPAPAAAGTLAYILDGDVYVADPDGSNAVKIADGRPGRTAPSIRRVLVLGRGIDVVAGREVPRVPLRGLFSEAPGIGRTGGDVVISDAEGNVLATFPAEGMGHRVVARFHPRRGVGPCSRRRRLRGRRRSAARRSRCRRMEPCGDHDPKWMRGGTLAVDVMGSLGQTAAQRGGSPVQMRRVGRGLPRGRARGILARRIAHRSLVGPR